ncbi:CUB domain-containing protein 1-like [Takifugu flavidus]|uniref:CUB domain-containing protein 1-like n=1 Tax=Takifugu flavidus TaxID=433684 RepID=UPI002544285D|nr:CUB domain-containing protein 1-like [Takifugu flavidus]XP_056876743.1 CUB domain-containing protein 1-like [Takifugu flavidus]XP_056876744.1 CUB domain-containing protein 1-like [Takifugu flavidus]
MRLSASGALWGLFLLTLLDSAECFQTVIKPDAGSTVTVSTQLPSDQCAVCTISGVNDTTTSCHSSLSLEPGQEVKLLFNCSQPIEQAYAVKIAGTIECTQDACSPSTVKTQLELLKELTRTFSWELKAPEKIAVGLDILGEGLVETSQPCPNGLLYSVATSKSNSTGQTQYCQGGSVTRFDLLNQAVVSLKVEPNIQVTSVLFQVSAGPLKGRKMITTVDSSTTVVVERDPGEPDCEVCSVDGSTPSCSPTEKMLSNVVNLTLEFSCPAPQNVFSVKITKHIECTKTLCTPDAAEVHSDLFEDFQRSLTWTISVPDRTVLTLEFPTGLAELSGAQRCPDGLQLSVSTTKSDGTVKSQRYCRSGTASRLELLGATTVNVEVPKEEELEGTPFTARAAPRGGRKVLVSPNPDTIIRIQRVAQEPDCSVCENKDSGQVCNPQRLTLKDATNASVEFTCPQPQEVFAVEINREIDCRQTPCSGDLVRAESSLFPNFNQTFTWDLSVKPTQALQLDVPEAGMHQIPNGDTCPDEHTYSLVTYLRSGPATIGTFCTGGTITSIMVLYKARMTLQVPGNRKLEPVDFKLSNGPETSMVASVKVLLPRGVSSTSFFTANYPRDFPDKQQVEWDFTVPGMHNYTVDFQEFQAPECLSRTVEVEYHKKGKKVTRLAPTDPQPQHQQGSFNMVLTNCDTNTTLPGLRLSYKVSLMRSGHPVLCTVDLTKRKDLSLHLERVGSDPNCEMSINSNIQEKINIAAGTKASLSFLDCPNEDVRLTANQVITCATLASCPPAFLTVPSLASCLPMPLHSFTWHVNVPQDSTVDLASPTGSLRQSLPDQECNGSLSLHVAESDGLSVGDFCFDGAIQKIQAHTNLSITARVPNFKKSRGPFLNVSFSQEIPETVIYRISPEEPQTLLATPNWPQGMKPSSTVSWIVTLPSQYQAHLQFLNVSQPKCNDRHTAIRVKLLGQEEELLSRREDEPTEDLLLPQSFYLNMSNCIPEEGEFKAMTRIILQKKPISAGILPIVLGVAGALLLLLIVLAVVCILKKKKSEKTNSSSIYISKGSFFQPTEIRYKSRSDNNSHIYDSIDETMVYGHLLPDSSYPDSLHDNYNGMQVDSYQTFSGPTDGKLPVIQEPDHDPEVDQFNTFLDPSQSFMPPRPRTPIDRQDSLGFQDSRMVDNELYTFKSTGDMNPIRLSAVGMEPPPAIAEDSL